MQGGREDRRTARSGRPEQQKVEPGSTSGTVIASTSTDATATTTAIVTGSGRPVTISDFVTHCDEAAKRRLNNMNQRLRRLEMQMEVLEAEVSKADESSKWS